MKTKVYETKTIGGVWFVIYVTENKNENILKIEDRLNKKYISYKISDNYIVRLIRIMEQNTYASGHDMALIINKKCRNLKIDLNWKNWIVEF